MCDSCGYEELIEKIVNMLEDSDFDFSADTLDGIRRWCAEKEHCTEKQEEAVENIFVSVNS